MIRNVFRYRNYFFFALLLLSSCGLFLGCSSAPAPEPVAPSEPIIRLSPGDVIEIKFPYADQFNETLTIRPDGKIALPLIGEVRAAGKTPTDLRDQLIRLHSKHLQHPELAVIVRTLYDRKVYVGGAVLEPGLIDMPGHLTALEAIMQAGGFDLISAKVENVILIRYKNGNKPEAQKLNLEGAIEGKEYQPVYLEPKDIVYVPRTTIVEIDQWVNQHIYELLPIGSVGFGYTLN